MVNSYLSMFGKLLIKKNKSLNYLQGELFKQACTVWCVSNKFSNSISTNSYDVLGAKSWSNGASFTGNHTANYKYTKQEEAGINASLKKGIQIKKKMKKIVSLQFSEFCTIAPALKHFQSNSIYFCMQIYRLVN